MTEDISFKLDKFDITVQELEKHESNGLDASWLRLLFGGKDFNIKIASALRRVPYNNLPSYAFPAELITIDTNTTIAFNNDYLRLRLSQLPIMGADPDMYFLHEKYWNKLTMRTQKEKNIQMK